MKTETVHARVDPEIKTKAEKILRGIGLTTSQAISLFLTAVVNHQGVPFELALPLDAEKELAFAKSVATVDGVPPSSDAERIMSLFTRGEIDYETAQFAIARLYQ